MKVCKINKVKVSYEKKQLSTFKNRKIWQNLLWAPHLEKYIASWIKLSHRFKAIFGMKREYFTKKWRALRLINSCEWKLSSEIEKVCLEINHWVLVDYFSIRCDQMFSKEPGGSTIEQNWSTIHLRRNHYLINPKIDGHKLWGGGGGGGGNTPKWVGGKLKL